MVSQRNSRNKKESLVEIEDQIRSAAELIFDNLYHEGDMDLEDLREKVSPKVPFFDWGIGWLVGKGDIEIFGRTGSFTVRKKPPSPVIIPLRGN